MDVILYRPEEVALVLGSSRSTVFELLASGEIESVKIGRSRRIPRQSVEAYVARLMAQQTPSVA